MALLTGFEFCFLLATFNSVLYSDVLFGILQNKQYDMQFCLSSIDDFCSTTEREKAKFDSIYEDTVRKVGGPSGRRAQRVGVVRAVYQQLHSEILDNILTQLSNRLLTKLMVMYNMTNFEARSPSDLLHFLTLKELTESMPQLYHLTIPVSTSTVEPSFSGLKHITGTVLNSIAWALWH
ncbi:hypothetical protein D5F01_LYC23766 [Larimichthys crocea]|uniref:HAT C-terminal dimerisation domain-containing protein n=1 Tax=Larimichthys crocea TaxID=215358 RepID=A0A6G0HGJ0_LARCR|nr:hypothetical protein D5F01_LYC23766 [Larimichthys crocea]